MSLNKCFEKIENPTNGSKKGCLWALNPEKCKKLEEECKRCRQRDPVNIRLSMSRPDDLNKIERGEQRLKKFPSLQNHHHHHNRATTLNKVSTPTTPSIDSNHINRTLSNVINNSNSSSSSLNNESFLLEWTASTNNNNNTTTTTTTTNNNNNNKNILKEEVSYFIH